MGMVDADVIFAKEYWIGDSRDGNLVNGEGFHYYRMLKSGRILEAYEFYEREDGTEVVSPLPEMKGVDWIKDLGFEDLDILDIVPENEYERIKEITKQ